jgi:hypothetical protein
LVPRIRPSNPTAPPRKRWRRACRKFCDARPYRGGAKDGKCGIATRNIGSIDVLAVPRANTTPSLSVVQEFPAVRNFSGPTCRRAGDRPRRTALEALHKCCHALTRIISDSERLDRVRAVHDPDSYERDCQIWRDRTGTLTGAASSTLLHTRLPTALASLTMAASSIVRILRSRITKLPSTMMDSMSDG